MSKECANCGRGYEEITFQEEFLYDVPLLDGLPWCRIGCALRYAKDRLIPLQYASLRSMLSERMDYPLTESPPLSKLRNRGGDMTYQEYHKGEVTFDPTVNSERRKPTKRRQNLTS